MTKWQRTALSLVTAVMMAAAPGALTETVRLNPQKPQTLTIWHYYNGIQQQMFDRMILAFNEGIGAKEGIIVEAHSQGNINDLNRKLLDSATGQPGASAMPDLFGAYADTAYQLDQMGLVADLSRYLTQEEQDAYVEAYWKEGELNQPGALKLFPIAKSTELLLLNQTDWQPFAEATGADTALLATWEGITQLSQAYYEWSDALTPDTPNDGKAFFGRDAFANYILIGSLQLGAELFRTENNRLVLNVEEDVMRRLWDNYAVPYVNGWFGAFGRYRSDDIKTGQLIALVGSTSGALYFPSEVTHDDGTSYPIVCKVYPLPNFKDTEPYAVQQGAGLVVTANTPEKEYAATLFLKWFTAQEQNIDFSVHSGYLPVLKAANNQALLDQWMQEEGQSALFRDTIDVGVQIINQYHIYTNDAFEHGYEARQVVENSMRDAVNTAIQLRDERIAQGEPRAQVIAELTGDQAFAQWLASFRAALSAAVQ